MDLGGTQGVIIRSFRKRITNSLRILRSIGKMVIDWVGLFALGDRFWGNLCK